MTTLRRIIALLLPALCASAMEAPAFSGRSLDEVPDGTALKRELTALAPAARAAALARLASVPRADAGSLHSDGGGRLLYRCQRPPVHGTAAAAAAAPVAAAAAVLRAPLVFPVAPAHHSRPGSANVIYLDFTGASVTGGSISGTAWNDPDSDLPHATTFRPKPYDRDGDDTTFSASEQADITDIWKRVAEDYSPFDVDVTTEKPAGLTTHTAWALITPDVDRDSQDLPHKSAGGIAYISVFGDPDYATYSPAWVWATGTGYPSSVIAEEAAHEVGHNMGLHHDGLTGPPHVEYCEGFDMTTTAPSWGPIMGAAYDRDMGLWSKGEYLDANNHEDDLAIIAGRLGYRADDAGGAPGTATALTIDGSSHFTVDGVIGGTGDVDAFSVNFAGGALHAQVTPFVADDLPPDTVGGDLDVLLTLVAPDGTTVVASNDPLLDQGATLDVTVPAGTYTLLVAPAAKGTPTAASPSGYTIYGVLGQYTLSGTATAQPLTVSPSSIISFGAVALGSSVDRTATFTNGTAGPLVLTGFSTSLATGITLVGSAPTVPQALAAGASFDVTLRFTPTVLGTKVATATATTDLGGALTVTWSGTGVAALAPAPAEDDGGGGGGGGGCGAGSGIAMVLALLSLRLVGLRLAGRGGNRRR